MIVYSDLLLEPFLNKREGILFVYSEDYNWDEEIQNENVLFIFSDYYRCYSRENLMAIFELIQIASSHNNVCVIDDLLLVSYKSNCDFNTIKSNISLDDFDLTLGDYCQFPFNKLGSNKLDNCINSWTNKIRQPILKAAFVDLDNTLIPGVWEEDNAQIRKDYFSSKGYNYRRLWKIMKKLYSHGTQIIIVSKNDKTSLEEALNFIDPFYMEYVTHIDYGWESKGQRIKILVNKLNIGFSDCLFIDDNPIEVKSVISICPDINFIQFEGHADLYELWSLYIMGLDINKQKLLERNEFYSASLKSSSSSKSSSNIKFSFNIEQNHEPDYERIKELSVKTNQMNFCKQQIVSELDKSDYDVFTLKVVTEFGNLGTVGYALYNKSENVFVNFVMSCRAIGFGAEQKFIEYLINISMFFSFKKSLKNTVAEQLISKYIEDGRIIIKNL